MSIEDIVMLAAVGVYRFLPAYLANASALAFGGGRALDGNRLFLDGKPLLGSHKTLRGFAAGIAAGTFVGLVQGDAPVGLAMGFGAVLGDAVGAFLKRRLSIPPGEPFPGLDQFDFLIGAYAVSFPILALPPASVLLVFICTPAIHVVSNYVSCALGIKKVPW
ncbi:MAG: CDP-2,3-bis-(O-geranylgeranyl)-sn-glycerol synthase [Candidatus Brockarchaeota archaeon]|nr:CDP-2,3-bis-(O-geranylgeranyl)-sn-glycerol synthase [Candidatus Brockarchaeota archaeon]